LNEDLAAWRDRCNAQLPRLLGGSASPFHAAAEPLLQRLFEASAYSLTDGGKRLRPLLVYASAATIDPACLQEEGIDYVACAVEMIHAYSLVHDDLPAMDDDALRRGKPTCHVAYDEATAVLVGDGLQARAFELLTLAPGLDAAARLSLVRELAEASGARGMVGGQAIDIAAADQQIDIAHLQSMHALKTGALIRAAVGLGVTAAGGKPAERQALDDFARTIGLAFQVRDDLLDIEQGSEALGKTQGADAARNKPTYVSALGAAGAKETVDKLLEDALDAIADFGERATPLRDIARFIANRRY
jgi:geranylgeranyl pyrophosphate synthase